MSDSLLVFVSHQQVHRALSIGKQVGTLGPEAREVKRLITSPSAAKIAREVGGEAAPDRPTLLNVQGM